MSHKITNRFLPLCIFWLFALWCNLRLSLPISLPFFRAKDLSESYVLIFIILLQFFPFYAYELNFHTQKCWTASHFNPSRVAKLFPRPKIFMMAMGKRRQKEPENKSGLETQRILERKQEGKCISLIVRSWPYSASYGWLQGFLVLHKNNMAILWCANSILAGVHSILAGIHYCALSCRNMWLN